MLPLVITPSTYKFTGKDFGEFLKQYRTKLFELVAIHGAILFRGFHCDSPEKFSQCTKLMVDELQDYIGGDSPRDKLSPGLYTSTNYPREEEISLHNEKSYSKNHPSYIWFYCNIAPRIGGETPIADGRILYREIDDEIINNFKEKKLKYIMNLHSGDSIGKSWQETFETDDRNELEARLNKYQLPYYWKKNGLLTIEEVVDPIVTHPLTGEHAFFSQADQWHPSNLDHDTRVSLAEILPEEDFYHNCYYGDGSSIEEEYLNRIREVVQKNKVMFPWQKNDVLMLDNLITLHGRSAFQGPREIFVCMA